MQRYTPCDNGACPYLGEGTTITMYFCRDNCGLGVDEDSPEDNYEPDDSRLEEGYDPYSGCYTDDC